MELVLLLAEDVLRALEPAFDQFLDFGVDQLVGFRAAHGARGLAHAEIAFLAFLVLQRAQLVAHAPFGDHVAREIGGILDIARRPARNLVVSEDDLFRHAPAHRNRQVRMHLVAVVGIAVAFGQAHHHAQRAAARNDGRLVDRVRRRLVEADQRVACLVIGGHLLLVLGHYHAAPFGTHHDLVLGVFEFLHRDQALVAARRQQGGLVAQVRQIRAREARRAARDGARVDVGSQWQLLHMHCEDFLAPVDIGHGDHNLTVEPARTQQRGVKNVGAVGRRDDNDAFIGFEAIHLDQQLVERLLALVVRIAQPVATAAPDGIDFVDKQDARRVLLRLFEHVAHAAGADTDEHLDEVRTGDGEEGHARFAGDCPREQGLTRTR